MCGPWSSLENQRIFGREGNDSAARPAGKTPRQITRRTASFAARRNKIFNEAFWFTSSLTSSEDRFSAIAHATRPMLEREPCRRRGCVVRVGPSEHHKAPHFQGSARATGGRPSVRCEC